MTDINVLLVEDNEADAAHFERLLRSSEARSFVVTTTRYLNTAYMALDSRKYDAVLLDLTLPDSPVGIHTLAEFAQKVQDIPIIVLTGSDDLNLTEQAISLGAQDYVVKNEVLGRHLERAIVQGIQRKKNEDVRRDLTYRSISGTLAPGSNDSRLVMVRPHVSTVLAYLTDVLGYLRDNAPEHYSAVKTLERERNMSTVVRELRDVLRVDRKSSQRVLDVARESLERVDVDTPIPPPPADPATARARILDIIKEYGRA